jgi:hypothetical protein
MIRRTISAVFAVAVALVIGCGTVDKQPLPENTDYFPLAVGNWWLYNETDNDPDTEWETRPVRHEVVDYIEMDFEYDAEGALPVFVVENTFPSGGGDADPRLYFDYDDGSRVVRRRQEVYDKETDVLSEIREWEPGLLKFDRSQTALGDEWEDEHVSYTISAPPGADVVMESTTYVYQVGDPESVTVPAGTFDCAVLRRFETSGNNAGELKVYYFAPGVGKVKEVSTPDSGLVKVEELAEYHVESPDGGV